MAAELIHRENVRGQHIEIVKKPGESFTELPKEFLKASDMTKVDFPVSTVELNRNYTFTGRDDDLNRVHELLTRQENDEPTSDSQLEAEHFVKRKSGPACCVLHGLAGIGKSQIALEYTYRHRSEYDAIFWLAAEHDWTLASTYAQISDQLGLIDPKTFADDGHKRRTLAIEKAREWLQSTGNNPELVLERNTDGSPQSENGF